MENRPTRCLCVWLLRTQVWLLRSLEHYCFIGPIHKNTWFPGNPPCQVFFTRGASGFPHGTPDTGVLIKAPTCWYVLCCLQGWPRWGNICVCKCFLQLAILQPGLSADGLGLYVKLKIQTRQAQQIGTNVPTTATDHAGKNIWSNKSTSCLSL